MTLEEVYPHFVWIVKIKQLEMQNHLFLGIARKLVMHITIRNMEKKLNM